MAYLWSLDNNKFLDDLYDYFCKVTVQTDH